MVTKAMLEQENENLRLRVAHLEKQLATLKQEENEIRIHTKTGEEHIRIVNTHPLENNGQPLNFTTMQDVTEHKQAEEQRARLAERLDLATRSAQIGIWDWDIVKNEIVWDDQMYALYGLQPGEFGGAYEAWLHGVHPDDRETSNDVSAAAVRGEREYDTEFRVVWPDGSVHWLKANGEVFRNELGNPIRMVGVNYDVTERKRLEENFRESEKKYTLLFQKSAVPVFLIRLPEVRIADANEAAEHLTGYTRAEMLGKNAAELGLISPKQRAETISTFEKEKALAENEMRITTKSGEECIIVINTNPLVIGGQPFAITTMQDITKRKKAEDKLLESERRLRQSQHIAHIGSWEWNLRTGETRWSPENYVIHGLSPDQPALTSEALLNYIHPDDLERVTAVISQAVSAGSSVELDYRLYRTNGALRVIHAMGEVTEFDAEGKPLVMLGTNQDITERKQVETELIESEKRFSTAFFASPVSQSIIARETSEVLAVNDACCRLFGYSPEELIGLSTTSLGLWENPADRLAAVEELQRTGHLTAREATVRVRSGEIHTVIVAIEPISWKGMPCFISSLFDITDRKIAERQLQENERKYRELVQNANSAIIRWKSDGTIVFFNEFAQAFFGYRPEEIIGQPVGILVPQTDSTGGDLSTLVQSIVDHPEQFVNVVNENICSDGRRVWMAWTNKPIYDEHGRAAEILAVGLDITERKRMEDELLRSNAELEQFAYVASHDLQEPLRTVSGMVQLLQQRYQGKLDERADEYIGHAVDGSNRMQQLINDLLDFSRVERKGNPFKTTDMNHVLQMALASLHVAIAESGAQITSDPLPTVMADAGQLTQVLQNLIGNAIKFRGEEPLKVHVGAEKIENGWQFAVRDNGIGIDPQYFERVFLIFQRLHTRSKYPGTGIGLALCKKIIERHGGRMWIQSEVKHGATFFFTIPERASS